MKIMLTSDSQSVLVNWDGCIPWTNSNGESLGGVIGAYRRVGKPYEYEMGEIKVRGYDQFIIMRTDDTIAGKLRRETIVTVQSRANPNEPPKQYMVRMVDEMGDTNAHVYLLNIQNSDSNEPDEQPEPDTGVKEMDRQRPRGRRINRR